MIERDMNEKLIEEMAAKHAARWIGHEWGCTLADIFEEALREYAAVTNAAGQDTLNRSSKLLACNITGNPAPAAPHAERRRGERLTFDKFRQANITRCVKWHPKGIDSWSPSDWLTAVTGELGELASLLKMRNRERDGLPGNKFSPTDKQIADELADVLTYLDLLAAVLGVDLGAAAVEKFNEVSERVGFPDRIELSGLDRRQAPQPSTTSLQAAPSQEGVGQGGIAEADDADLIRQLRDLSAYKHSDFSLGSEAAARIEALVRDVQNLRATCGIQHTNLVAANMRAESAEARLEARR